jgi:hypothetical protein
MALSYLAPTPKKGATDEKGHATGVFEGATAQKRPATTQRIGKTAAARGAILKRKSGFPIDFIQKTLNQKNSGGVF